MRNGGISHTKRSTCTSTLFDCVKSTNSLFDVSSDFLRTDCGTRSYVRLFLRKTSAWHRISGLGYHSDIADLGAAIDNLQLCRSLPISTTNPQTNPGELTPPEGTTLGDTFAFADRSEDGITTLEEASSLLKLDELKALAKEAKFQGKNKSELLKSLRRTSQKQTGLKWSSLRRSDTASSTASNGSITNEDSREETPLREDCQEENRETHFLQKIMAETGPCIRLSLPTLKLFERVHLVFYRSTEWTEKSLTTIILAQISRRNFPEYIVSRSSNIFASREILLEFEAALRTQFRVDSILEFGGKPTAEGYQSILNIFREVLPRWRVLLREEQRKEDSVYLSGEGAYLRRLSPAWVYTRIVHKASLVLGKQKEHLQEHAVLCELLEQRLFHPARRGAWYQRRALLEEHYIRALNPFDGRSEEAQKRHWKRIALCTCEEGLQDKLVHLCYHYDLQKRVGKLERALRVPKRQQHSFAHVQLAAPIEVTVTGIRLERKRQPSRRPSASDQQPASHRGERTIWLDPACDTHTECTVEEMVLSHCRGQGWKGFHSEGGIMRTLFALLFYDVLFAYVPHVFQTAFQTCPLDLHSDGFFPARAAAIEHRLVAISNGEAGGILAAVWDAHAERETCVVGLDWSFAREDLVEIVDCFAGAALAAVCKVMAQDYGQRGGGVPDLFLWRTDQGLVKFVEVKSENDRLSDTQRLWVHVLTGAGVAVELCNAVAKEVRVMD